MKEGSLYGPLYHMTERKLIFSPKERKGKSATETTIILKNRAGNILPYGRAELATVFAGVTALFYDWKEDENDKRI